MTLGDGMRIAVSVLAGAGIGWAAQALTLAGRVEAIERGQVRIEQRLDQILDAKGKQSADRP